MKKDVSALGRRFPAERREHQKAPPRIPRWLATLRDTGRQEPRSGLRAGAQVGLYTLNYTGFDSRLLQL